MTVTQDGTNLVVTWNPVTNADSYIVQRQEAGSGSSFASIQEGVGTNTFTDATVVEGVGYNYRIIAVNTEGQTNPSDPAFGEIGLETGRGQRQVYGPFDVEEKMETVMQK